MHLTLRPVIDFSDALQGREPLAVGVGPGGRLAALVGEEVPGKPLPAHPIGPNEPATFVTAAIIWDGEESTTREVPLGRVRVRYPIVQPLPDGGVLVAGSRVAVGEEPNALVVDPKGRLQRRLLLGDGIEHIQVGQDGRAWVGYFDEGVYGNLGWGRSRGREPIGSSGLDRFDLSTGELDWSFKAPVDGAVIDDCYALNVAADAVWVYYYSAFDLVRIDPDGSTRRWATHWSGARVIAIDGTSVLLIGTHREPTSAGLRQLGDTELTDPREVVLDRSDGRPPSGRLMGRGDRVYLVDGPLWLDASIGEISSPGGVSG